ncbi:unnamed protein product [Pylaiella littoralis]
MPSCRHVGCDGPPLYGKAGTKNGEFCSQHRRDGMVKLFSRRCAHPGCTTHPAFGVPGSKPELCRQHAQDGMINVVKKTCGRTDCMVTAGYGFASTNKAEFCAKHARNGMVNVRIKRCHHGKCTGQATTGVAGTKIAKFCYQHAQDGMVDMSKDRCGNRDCIVRANYGIAGSNKAEFCIQHAPDGMVDVRNKRCARRGCDTRPSFGKVGAKKAEFCYYHANEGMVNTRTGRICGRKGESGARDRPLHSSQQRCRHAGCTTRPSFGQVGTKHVEFCINHAKEGMVNPRTGRVCDRKRTGDACEQIASDIDAGDTLQKRAPVPPEPAGNSPAARGTGKRKRVRMTAVMSAAAPALVKAELVEKKSEADSKTTPRNETILGDGKDVADGRGINKAQESRGRPNTARAGRASRGVK